MRRARHVRPLPECSVIVTGAGSGIGAALARAFAGAGAAVWCTDVDETAATATARDCGARATAARLDVTDAGAVAELVDTVAATHGRIDVMVNNAGISFGGDTELLGLDRWNAIIDVNLRGVVHGVDAAYRHMIRQGEGHIVSTASMGGLTPAGLITSYVATKHAVVGLSLALRSEAVAHGVRVLALCPAAVETPLLDAGSVGGFRGRDYYLTGQGVANAYSADRLAAEALDAMARDRALLVVPARARAAWRLYRLAPGLLWWSSQRFVAARRRGFDQTQPENPDGS
ncbi:MAG: SDR family NAD(P)-dependent oxidoreductase [Williamsia herbipolensis]|nr:SDR family NAD(P)-dependent oxidoreductase [Williamsia herbipolensis]